MISVKVTYTVQQAFAATNRKNIQAFLEDFKQLDNSLFTYSVFAGADGNTFVHLSVYKNEAIQKELLNVPSFLFFQKQRDESGLEATPVVEVMEVVGLSQPL